MKQSQTVGKLAKSDRVKFILSIACLVHCAAVPLLVIVLPSLGAELLHNVWVELVLVSFGLLVAGSVLIRDFMRVHKHVLPTLILFAGFVIQLLGIFADAHAAAHLVLIAGSLLVASAYLVNWKLKTNHQATCSC